MKSIKMTERRISKLCIVSDYYPTPSNPIYMFVDVLIRQFADMDIECHVLVVTNKRYDKNKGEERVHITEKGNKVYVHCPQARLFLNRKILGIAVNMYGVNTWIRYFTLRKAYYTYVRDADAIYAHFWLYSGLPAAMLGKKVRKPVFIATGESLDSFYIDTIPVMKKRQRLWRQSLRGVITVSTALKEAIEKTEMLPKNLKDGIRVIPNAIEPNLFFYRNDKKQLRKKYHISEEKFVVLFVGSFSDRKGYDVLYHVLEKNPLWIGIMIGEEIEEIHPEHILFPGKIPHEMLPEYMNLADVFVLPTVSEGCCNAIIEAMACGLPVVTSDREFNYDIVDRESGVLVDPLSESEVEEAIKDLEKDSNRREYISKNAMLKIKKLTIENRALKIYNFLEENMRKENSIR